MSTVPQRCRYSDCSEGHPVATDDSEPTEPIINWVGPCDGEPVTCPTCREWLGLPALIPGTLDYVQDKP